MPEALGSIPTAKIRKKPPTKLINKKNPKPKLNQIQTTLTTLDTPQFRQCPSPKQSQVTHSGSSTLTLNTPGTGFYLDYAGLS